MAERILLYRPGFLGDVVMSLPAVRLVREYHPDAHITYATLPPCDEILRHCPWIDEIKKAGSYRLADYDAVCHFRHEAFPHGYDLAEHGAHNPKPNVDKALVLRLPIR